MRVCVVSFKECWQDDAGRWLSYGGFPLQMGAIATLFEEMTLVIVRGRPRSGGIPLPERARVVPLRRPDGTDTVRKLSVVSRLPYYLGQIFRQVRVADVVHAPLPGDISLLGLYVGLALRKFVIARYGGSWAATSQTTMMNKVTRETLRRFAGGRNVMLATGAGQADPSPFVKWIYVTAISREEVASVTPDLERGPQRPLRLAYVGRLSEEKGVADLITACALWRRERAAKIDPPHLVIIGDGPQRAALQALALEHELGETVEFAGQLDRQELIDRLLTIDLCVLPSLTESFCKARLDAMLCGVPVVTTEVGFGREIVGADGERGWTVPAEDPGALASVLHNIQMADLDWPSLRRRCRAYVEERTLEAWAARIGEICAEQWQNSFDQDRVRR